MMTMVCAGMPPLDLQHPLQNKWTFYYRNPKLINLSWNEQVQKIYTFDTVEDFWA